MNAPTIVGTYDGKTAQEWQQMATDANRRSYESFERCDTDGALSQWAADSVAKEYRLAAELAEANGMWEFEALFDLDGNFLSCTKVANEYGDRWYIARPADGRRYLSTSEAKKGTRRQANDEKKGVRVGTIRAAGRVKAYGASITSVGYYVERDERDEKFEIVDNGTQGTRYEDWDF